MSEGGGREGGGADTELKTKNPTRQCGEQKLEEVDIETGATVLSNKDWRSYGDIMGHNHQDVGLSSNPRIY